MSPHAVWNRYMTCYDALEKMSSYKQNIDDISSNLPSVACSDILDAGSGTGNLSILLGKRGAKVVSLDFSKSAIDKHLQKDPNATVFEGSLEEKLPFADQSFDTVCCISVLFTLTKSGCRTALCEFNRVLRPGGTLITSVAAPGKRNSALLLRHFKSIITGSRPIQDRISALLDVPNILRVAYYNRLLQKLPDWEGYHRFSESELREFLSEANFQGIEIGRTYAGQFFLASARKASA
jgi:ubiquinone/menaquinone biosynthesis C-methylase UbiE